MVELEDKLQVKRSFRFNGEQLPAGAMYEVISIALREEGDELELIRIDDDAPVGDDSQIVKGFSEDDVQSRFTLV